jgi:hypothetical protein
MKTITVIPKYVGVSPSEKEFSAYGSFREGDKLVKTSKFTWELNENGTITVGLGRMAANTKEEAVEVAKAMESKGYVYEGIRE